MAVTPNTIKTPDIVHAEEIDAVKTYEGKVQRFAEVLGMFDIQTRRAGTSIKSYSYAGELANGEYLEGDEVALTHITRTEVKQADIDLYPYETRTTAKQIQSAGYEAAIAESDEYLLSKVRAKILGDFFTWIKPASTLVDEETLQATLAKVDAEIMNQAELTDNEVDGIVHFVPRSYATEYLANANIVTGGQEPVFGMTYLQNFLGVEHVFITNKVDRVIATPINNVRIYGLDYEDLAEAGLEYTVGDLGLIGIAHNVNYGRVSAETFVIVPTNNFYCEITNFVVAGTVTAG